MSQEKPAEGRKDWEAPQIVEVGGVAETTSWAGGNVRDNQGDPSPKYRPNTVEEEGGGGEAALPQGD